MSDLLAWVKTIALILRHPRVYASLKRSVERCDECYGFLDLCEHHDAEVLWFTRTGERLPDNVVDADFTWVSTNE